MSNVAPEVTKQLMENQLRLWQNTLEDCRISAKVADAIEDSTRKDAVLVESKKCVKAIEALEKMLTELDEIKT